MVKWLYRCWADRRAVTGVDFALLAPVFVTFVTLLVEVCWQLALGAGLDHGTRVAARWGTLGALPPAGSTAAQQVARVVREASGMPIDARRLTVTATAFASLGALTAGTGGTAGMGSTGQMVRYEILYMAPALTPIGTTLVPNGLMTHKFTLIARNEPY